MVEELLELSEDEVEVSPDVSPALVASPSVDVPAEDSPSIPVVDEEESVSLSFPTHAAVASPTTSQSGCGAGKPRWTPQNGQSRDEDARCRRQRRQVFIVQR